MRSLMVSILFCLFSLTSCTGFVTTREVPELQDPEPAVIYYHRTGGITGLDEEYWIFDSGRIGNNEGQEWTVPSEDVRRLLEQIEQAGLSDDDYESPSVVPCCDRLSYELTIMSGGRRTLKTHDGAPNVPANVQFAFDSVAGFIQDHTRP